ncbi:BMP family ABC transporter substrate-binding protein [Metabacillus herbersteinensis]|uniref:BMP family ABC transporter substrate-binding protein n=1 Tax=Metabacillus herbersteinensis TaxID=283816 RepID=A0ABV6GIH2_9BACI
MQQQSKQLRFISFITMIVVTVVLVTIGFKANDILTQTDAASQVNTTKVSILTSDVIVDQSWGSLAYKGQLKIEEQFPLTVKLYSEIATEKLMQSTVEESITRGSEIIIGHGREFSEVFTSMAPKHPDVHFVTLHGDAKHSNQTVYTFDQGQIEYFAALSASLKTESNKVALLDAFEAREKNPEFEKGIKHYNPNAEFYYKVVNSRDDGKKAIQLMNELISEGVDVVYTKGNAYNREVINIAKSHNVYVIGYLDDQSYMGKDHVLTSVVNDVPQAYVSIMKDFFSAEGIPSGKVMLNESDGVYKLAPFGPMYTEEEKEMIQSEINRFHRGDFPF